MRNLVGRASQAPRWLPTTRKRVTKNNRGRRRPKESGERSHSARRNGRAHHLWVSRGGRLTREDNHGPDRNRRRGLPVVLVILVIRSCRTGAGEACGRPCTRRLMEVKLLRDSRVTILAIRRHARPAGPQRRRPGVGDRSPHGDRTLRNRARGAWRNAAHHPGAPPHPRAAVGGPAFRPGVQRPHRIAPSADLAKGQAASPAVPVGPTDAAVRPPGAAPRELAAVLFPPGRTGPIFGGAGASRLWR